MNHPDVVLIDHPLVQHKLTLMRERDTSTSSFRRLMHEISILLAYELTRSMPMRAISIETPLETMQARLIDGKKMVFVPILRAGQGLLEGMLEVVPGARVGHVGLYRDPATLDAIEYYCKLPQDLADRDVVVLDPMLATGHSAIAAVDRVSEAGARSIRLACLVAAPEGLAALHAAHPAVIVYTAAIDRGLDEHGYIVPGLGDAGDRLYGTR
jgi:uracil phosphoribosyltransferase